jgi:uncharacterized membrane protein YeaQ/YmgE (transglycosylase-associated protein family)
VGMVAWLVIGVGVGWLLGRRNGKSSSTEMVMAVAYGVVGAILGGLAAGFAVEGQFDLEWQPGGVVGAALGALVVLVWVRPWSR